MWFKPKIPGRTLNNVWKKAQNIHLLVKMYLRTIHWWASFLRKDTLGSSFYRWINDPGKFILCISKMGGNTHRAGGWIDGGGWMGLSTRIWACVWGEGGGGVQRLVCGGYVPALNSTGGGGLSGCFRDQREVVQPKRREEKLESCYCCAPCLSFLV